MRNRSLVVPGRWRKFVLRAALASVATPIIIAIVYLAAIRAQDATDWQTKAGSKMAFDVASVKPSKGR
jgi:hypothetical protein